MIKLEFKRSQKLRTKIKELLSENINYDNIHDITGNYELGDMYLCFDIEIDPTYEKDAIRIANEEREDHIEYLEEMEKELEYEKMFLE